MSERLKEQSVNLKVDDDIIAPAAAPVVFDGIEVNSLFMRNANSVIYKGTLLDSGNPVAIKVTLHPVHGADFEQYAKVVAKLKNPPHGGIATVHSYGRLADGKAFVVTDWIEWDSLRLSTMMKGQIDNRIASLIISEICDALDAAHRGGIAHGSLRPENIFVLVEGKNVQVKIVDFGSHFLQALEDHQGTITDVYLSPEVRLCKVADARSDVFSLAAIIFNMAMGEHLPVIFNESLYFRNGKADLQTSVRREEISYSALSDMQQCTRKIPSTRVKALDVLVQRALQPNPRLRPQNAVEFKHTIQHAIFSKAPIGTGLQPAVNPRSQRWIPISVAVVALIMLAALLVVEHFTEVNKPPQTQIVSDEELRQMTEYSTATTDEGSKQLSFPYALLAKSSMTINGDVHIRVRRSVDGMKIPSPENYTGRPLLGAFGKVHGERHLAGGQSKLTQGGREFNAVCAEINQDTPFPVGNLLVPPFPTEPAKALPASKDITVPLIASPRTVELNPNSKQIVFLKRGLPTRLRSLTLSPGDYIIGALPECNLRLADKGQKGAIRFFLSPDEDAPSPSINLKANTVSRIGSHDVQYWYDGNIPIKIAGKLTGVVYAPNAKVILEDGAVLVGAIVANEIEVGKGVTIFYDPQLMQKREW